MFLAMTEGDSEEVRQKQARKAVFYMVCILIAFLIGGTFIMKFFGLSLPGLRIAGGILVSGVGMRMLYPKDDGGQTKAEEQESRRAGSSAMCHSLPWQCPVWLAPEPYRSPLA